MRSATRIKTEMRAGLAILERFAFGRPAEIPVRAVRIIEKFVLVLLYLVGVFYWVRLLDYGAIDPNTHDWTWEFPFHSVIKEALTTFRIPFYISMEYHANDHFLAFANIAYSPQIILLRFLSIGNYLLINVLLLFSLGFHGCLLLRRKYGLSLVAFAFVLALMLFNGYVTSHLAVGHTQWFSCFFLPYFIYLTLDIEAGNFSRKRMLLIALVLFVMILNGAVHIALMASLYLLLIVLFNPSVTCFVRLVQTAACTALLGACKLVPAIVFFGDKSRDFLVGFTSINELLEQLTLLQRPDNVYGLAPLGEWKNWVFPWEHNAYIGLTGFLFLVICGVLPRFRKAGAGDGASFKNMDWPMFVMLFLSFEANYLVIQALHIPFISTVERVPSRFIIMPLLTLAAIAAIRYQAMLNDVERRRTPRLLGLLGIGHLGYMLFLHSGLWRTSRLPTVRQVREATIVSGNDRPYEFVVAASFVATLVAVAVWGYLYVRTIRKGKRRGAETTPAAAESL